MDFIEQLWYCEERYKTAETFVDHPWLTGTQSKQRQITGNQLFFGVLIALDNFLIIKTVPSTIDSGRGRNKAASATVETMSGYCYIKMREKRSGRRQWHRRWAVVLGPVLLLYLSSDEDKNDNQNLASAVQLRHKTAVVLAVSRHDFTFGLQDTNLQQIVLWMRFDTEDEYARYHRLHLILQ